MNFFLNLFIDEDKCHDQTGLHAAITRRSVEVKDWKQIYILQKHLLKIPTTISLCIYLFVLFWWSVSEALMFPGHN